MFWIGLGAGLFVGGVLGFGIGLYINLRIEEEIKDEGALSTEPRP